MIVTSSSASIAPLPGLGIYCASKTFVSYLFQALYVECGNKIDVLDWKPSEIDTKILVTKENRARGVSVPKAVGSIWKDLGVE